MSKAGGYRSGRFGRFEMDRGNATERLAGSGIRSGRRRVSGRTGQPSTRGGIGFPHSITRPLVAK